MRRAGPSVVVSTDHHLAGVRVMHRLARRVVSAIRKELRMTESAPSATPARLAPILAQYEFALDRLHARLDGLTDAEYFWEPAGGCWSVVRREACRTSSSQGGGEWVLEFERGAPEPGPLTTIAWRIAHLASSTALRADYTTGSRSLSYETLEMPGSASAGVAMLREAGAAWLTILRGTTDADLDTVGRSSMPWGLDPQLPFLDITWWVNQELLHHGGELGALRDFYAATNAGRPTV
jgi:hypothetical protein